MSLSSPLPPSEPNPGSFTSEAYVVLSPGGPDAITLERVTYPAPGPDELTIDICAVSVCATDLKAAAGKFVASPPLILGHEGAGTVVHVGSAESGKFHPGDKVVLSYASCGVCNECAAGANAYCAELGALNFTGRGEHDGIATVRDGRIKVRGRFFGQSSMGRRVVVRAACAVKLPVETTEEELRLFASLGCGIQTGAGAVLNVAKLRAGSSVLIFGAGSVGLAACLAARFTLAGAGKIVVVDNSTAKLGALPGWIRESGTETFNSAALAGDELVGMLRERSPDGRGFDLALDCVGSGEVVRIGHLALRPRGMVVSIGGSTDTALQVTLSQHLTRGITYRGTHQGDSVPSRFIPYLIELWRAGKFPFDSLLTLYDFGQLHRAIQDVREGRVIKPVLVNAL